MTVEIKYICDPSDVKIKEGIRKFGLIFGEYIKDYKKIMEDPEVSAVFVTSPDFTHPEITVAALKGGKHVYLEKPMAITYEGAKQIVDVAGSSKGSLCIGYTLRETFFYRKVKEILDSQVLGQIMHINMLEHLDNDHGASYMRRWHRKSSNVGSFLLAKSSHDIDLMLYFADSMPTKVSSFGGLNFFLPRSDASLYCSVCPENIKKHCDFVFTGYGNIGYDYNQDVKLGATPPDLCVYNNDKDTIDNQCVIVEMANGIRASFSLQIFGMKGRRMIHITGSKGHLYGAFEDGALFLELHKNSSPQMFGVNGDVSEGHGGGDVVMLRKYYEVLRNANLKPIVNYVAGYNSTIVCFKINESMKSGETVTIDKMEYLY